MKFLIVLASICIIAYARPSVDGTNVAVRQDTAGNYKYTIDSSKFKKHEERFPDGTLTGFYSYIDPNGQLITYKYISGPDGFRIVDGPLPVAPTPVSQEPSVVQPQVNYANNPFPHLSEETNYQPNSILQTVPDTPEVEAAKLEHFKAHAERLALLSQS